MEHNKRAIRKTTIDVQKNYSKIISRCLTPKQRKQFFLLPDPSYDFIEAGEQLAKKGEIKAAIAKFKVAKTLAPCHKFEPIDRATWLYAETLLEKGKALAKKGEIEAATKQFELAQKADSRLVIYPEQYAKELWAWAKR
jgi:tetratricopeptide (TPR) repeat protein